MASSLEDGDMDSSTLSDIESNAASALLSSDLAPTPAAPSTTVSLPQPTSAYPAPLPTDDHLDADQTYPPMTTPWTVPASCTWTYDADSMPSSGVTGPMAWLDLEPIPGAKSLSCYPDGMFHEDRTGVFSPGTCPHGWTTVSLLVETNEAREDEVTTAICCSSEYHVDGSLCKRSVPTVVAVPFTYNHTARSYDVLSDSTTTLYSATIAVYTIRALFKDGDKDALGLKDEDDIGNVRPNKPLSLGARIGIGVGVGVFVLLVIAAIAFWLLRRDRARTEKKRSHELNAMRSRTHRPGGIGDDFYTTANAHHRRERSRHHTEPPPAYEAGADSSSVTDNESHLSGDTTTRDEEIRALQVQKAEIQRRIQELERSETNQTQDENRQQ
ncbi:hypothetical protein FZEAL_5479 [Fusarium zealandicum]|uniref:Uncharacterized protein n=1 Tax=Fusarium zealandicum TaxID=1053134 RepID=A0A8H4UK31_9HYPO|nr:hypothetical protein FZEAL_5479 [Fusarium zealandicum]